MNNIDPPLRYCILLYFLFFSLPHYGQNLRQSVVASVGAYFEESNVGNLHWTIGEISVETYQSNIQLNQGFHQSYYELFITPNWSIEPSNFQITAFPNPTSGWLTFQTETLESLEITITNLLGQTLLPKHSFSQSTNLDLSGLPGGFYLAQISWNNQFIAVFKIQKIKF